MQIQKLIIDEYGAFKNREILLDGGMNVIEGDNESGKSTVLSRVMQAHGNLCFSVSATTRSPRPGEQNGVSYYFVTKDHFKEMIARDEFVEYDNHMENYYGTPKAQLEEKLSHSDVLLDIDPNGAFQVRKKRPDAVLIFIAPPSLEELERRLRSRGDTDEDQIRVRLDRVKWEVEQSKELRQILVHGQGEFHLRTLKWRLENIDKIQIEFYQQRIPYRETITKAARADYRHKKQSGGAGQFGEVHLIVEPYQDGMPDPTVYTFGGQEIRVNIKGKEEVELEWGGKLVFINSVVGGAIDSRFMPAILKGIMSRMEQGPLTGSYARDVRVVVYDGKMHPVDSNELSFMLAGRNAFSQAFREAGPKILEPIYDVEVFVPADKMGDVMSDLQGRRGMIVGMSSENGYEKLQAKVPLKEMSTYSTTLSSITGGRASFIMKFASYELVPSDIQNKLIAENEQKDAE